MKKTHPSPETVFFLPLRKTHQKPSPRP